MNVLDSSPSFTAGLSPCTSVTLPKEVRDRLGIESNDEIPATLVGSVLEVNPKPSSKLEPATADRDGWAASTPTDAGETLFGPMDGDR